MHLLDEERNLTKELEYWLGLEESRLKQNSREQWLNLCDKNSKFFYAVIKSRYSKNHISQFITDTGAQVSDLKQIRVLAPEYFQRLFNEKLLKYLC